MSRPIRLPLLAHLPCRKQRKQAHALLSRCLARVSWAELGPPGGRAPTGWGATQALHDGLVCADAAARALRQVDAGRCEVAMGRMVGDGYYRPFKSARSAKAALKRDRVHEYESWRAEEV